MAKKRPKPLKVMNRVRRIQYNARKAVEDRLTKQYGGTETARKRAQSVMKGKHVHKTGRGLELVPEKKHGEKHGRGNKGPKYAYAKCSKFNKKGT